uniref:Uncharacterized protein n=1 Tax=Caenorhabditis japonica TaxID=281687 RepID=A0A8R1HYE4_CAEJA
MYSNGIIAEEYTRKRPEEIPADERFLHRYTSSLQKNVKKETGVDEWEYAESVNSEEFDEILERFEPGELNEEFDIDYSKEFGAEKAKRKKTKAAEEEEDDVDMDEDDIDLNDLNEEEDGGMSEDDGDDVEDDDDDDDDDDGDDDDDEDDDDEGGFAGGKSSANIFGDDDGSSDEEIGEKDYEMAGDKFAEMLEDLEEDEEKKGKKGGKKRGVKRGGNAFKRGSSKKFRRH